MKKLTNEDLLSILDFACVKFSIDDDIHEILDLARRRCERKYNLNHNDEFVIKKTYDLLFLYSDYLVRQK